ncbi:MAG TPA: EAL domain-containing protein [Burkholderiaceae bacterium]|nr:EAL domain-containing protein [Burkholderiaceae bacterium]
MSQIPAPGIASGAPPTSALGPTDDVLLVDGDPVWRMLAVAALRERGWRVLETGQAEEAVAIFARERPQVVVLDAALAVPDGFGTCQRLRQTPHGEHVPIVMLTGLDDEHSIARAYEAGANDFFVKTVGQWTLLSERLRYLLRAAHARRELLISQARLHQAQRIARVGSWEWDFRSGRIRVSDQCRALAGLAGTQGDVPQLHAWSRVVPEDRGRIERLFREELNSGLLLTFEAGVVHPDGCARTVRVEAEFERDDDGVAVAMHGILQDVTERRAAEEQIRRLANYDSLTGLPNRRHLRDEFGATIERARGRNAVLALLFVDVDRFKQINDTLGHEVGDQVLREIAWRLHSTIRETDTVARVSQQAASPGVRPPTEKDVAGRADSRVARLGGDEFTVLLSHVGGPEDVHGILHRLIDALRAPVDCFGHAVQVTASVGVALFPRDGDDVDSLLRKADLAMYAAKSKGGNSWRAYDESMNVALSARGRLEAALQQAVQRGELVLHYQPKIDTASGQVVGAEALLRWVRDGDLVAPGGFLAVAEESGLIVPITEWAIAQVCWQISEWRRRGLRLVPIAVNVSGRYFERGNLAAPVRDLLARNGVAAQLLAFELTETVLMRDLAVALPRLEELKRLGVRILIDDFGTGYSSLGYLQQLPIDAIKIDRSFVRDLEINPDSATVVAAIIAMAKALRLRTIAEGVETSAQMQTLSGQGCTLMQGFLFSRPLPPEEFLLVAGALDARAARPGAQHLAPSAMARVRRQP